MNIPFSSLLKALGPEGLESLRAFATRIGDHMEGRMMAADSLRFLRKGGFTKNLAKGTQNHAIASKYNEQYIDELIPLLMRVRGKVPSMTAKQTPGFGDLTLSGDHIKRLWASLADENALPGIGVKSRSDLFQVLANLAMATRN